MKSVLLWLERTSDTTYCFLPSLEIRYNEVLLYILIYNTAECAKMSALRRHKDMHALSHAHH